MFTSNKMWRQNLLRIKEICFWSIVDDMMQLLVFVRIKKKMDNKIYKHFFIIKTSYMQIYSFNHY